MYQSFQDAAKAELKWKFMALKIQISDKEKPKIIAISIHLQRRKGKRPAWRGKGEWMKLPGTVEVGHKGTYRP